MNDYPSNVKEKLNFIISDMANPPIGSSPIDLGMILCVRTMANFLFMILCD